MASLLIPMEIAGLLASGLGAALLGSIKVPLAGRLGMDERHMGGLVSAFGLAVIPVVLAMGFLGDLVSHRLVAISGPVLMGASLVIFARTRSYWPALMAALLLSAGWSGLINVLNVLMPQAFGQPFGRDEVFATNLGNTFFGLGAFLTPLVVVMLVKRVGFGGGLLWLAVFALVPGLLAAGVDFAGLIPKPAVQAAGADTMQLLANPMAWLCSVGLLFYAPLEATMAAWFTTFLVEKGVREGTASGLLSAFWLSFMASRLAAAFGLPEGTAGPTLLVLSLLGTAVLAGVVASPGPRSAMAVVVVAGLVFGPVFPTLIGILLGHTAAAVHGRAVGLFFACGGVGWTVIPMAIGAYARRTSVQRGFMIAVASGLGLCLLALAILRSL